MNEYKFTSVYSKHSFSQTLLAIYITLVTNHFFQTIFISQLFLGHKSHDASLGGDLKVFDFCQVIINCVILAGFKKGFLCLHLIQMG